MANPKLIDKPSISLCISTMFGATRQIDELRGLIQTSVAEMTSEEKGLLVGDRAEAYQEVFKEINKLIAEIAKTTDNLRKRLEAKNIELNTNIDLYGLDTKANAATEKVKRAKTTAKSLSIK